MKKLLGSKWTSFLFGVIIGLLSFALYTYKTGSHSNNEYYKLNRDYCIDNVGYLKSGTLLQVDKGMSEGFTRYVLYLNLNDGEDVTEYDTQEKDMVIPYWLNYRDSICNE